LSSLNHDPEELLIQFSVQLLKCCVN